MDNFVEFKGVQKSYDGETLVVKDLNLSIARGDFVTLLGPFGSGKSTALMLLAGFEPPTRGTIELNGEMLNSVAPFDRNIGMVFQNYALFPYGGGRECRLSAESAQNVPFWHRSSNTADVGFGAARWFWQSLSPPAIR
ncbi:MAG: ATP-binding cassette domain-containing protein [Tateyamaria sp.]